MRNNFFETTVGCTISYFVKNYMTIALVLLSPLQLRKFLALFTIAVRSVAVTRHRMSYLVFVIVKYMRTDAL